MSRRAARLIARLAARLLPAPQRGWGRAMEAEAGAIEGALPAMGFALGCLGFALRTALRSYLLRPFRAAGIEGPDSPAEGGSMLDFLTGRPRRLAALCAIAATGLGLAWMAAAGAPPRYLAVNGAALLLGLLAVAVLSRVGDVGRGIVNLMLALLLLLTALIGISADGVTRWVPVGGVLLQPSLVLLPILALRFAGTRDALSTLAILAAALALALQPDRAMAGTLAAAMAMLALLKPERNVLIALAAAGAGFAATLLRADPSAATPFVDRIFFSSFAVHPLAGLAVAGGAALLLVPAALALFSDPEQRRAHALFGTIWLAVILAALLGNYPTPLVGYGGSAVLGYLISLLGLPPRIRAGAGDATIDGRAGPDDLGGHLRTGLPLSV